MNKFKHILLAIILWLTLILVFDTSSFANIEGIWQGKLKVSNIELRLILKISKDEQGIYKAKLDSPDQGVSDIPVDSVIVNNSAITIKLVSLRAEFEGIVDFEKSIITGNWKQGGMELPLVLEKTIEEIIIHRPQEPKKPYPYKEEEVIIANKKAEINLAGTFTLPKTNEPFPAVLLISGSGPQDRDEFVFGHKPFLILADHLTRNGIAVLRVDDRGIGKSTGNFSTATSKDFADDALACVEYLKSRKDINPKMIGLIGHSEGGIVAPMVATSSKDIAFIILMAGTGLTGEEIINLQSELILKASGMAQEIIEKNTKLQKNIFKIIKEISDTAEAKSQIRKVIEEAVAELTNEEKVLIGYSESNVDIQIKQLFSPWFKYFLTYDPKPALEKIKCPVLAIIGEKDLQVPPKENLRAIEEALKIGGNKKYTLKELKGLNHLFQTTETGSPNEYSKIEETISPVALETISDWILMLEK